MKKNWSSACQQYQAEECMVYFREHPIFDKIFRGFREKYVSYGNFSGTVILKNVSKRDLEVLEGFFQKNFHGKKSISISAVHFEKALKDSRFGSLSPREVLELYFQEEMTGKKERQREECKTAHCRRRKTQIIFGSSAPADCAVPVPTAVYNRHDCRVSWAYLRGRVLLLK